MTLTLLRTLIRSIGVILVVTFGTFLMMYGNGRGIAQATLALGASEEDITRRLVSLGLDRPLLVQYWDWLTGAVRGDLGRSFYTHEPVTSALSTRVPVTLSLVIVTLLLTAAVSVALGVTAAVRGGVADKLVQFFSVLGTAVPAFVVAIVLVLVFAVSLRWLPAVGFQPISNGIGGWAKTLVLPVAALLVGTIAGVASQFRTTVLDTLGKDYVRTLRARGVRERQVILRNVLRNASAPGMTALSLTMISLLGGTIFIETIFALPGMGRMATAAAQISDVPMVMGTVVVMVLLVLIVNLLSDVIVLFLNPKARTR